jgi:L-alanine-DL-glutamate epimerase-like enolase superfamily enzyme
VSGAWLSPTDSGATIADLEVRPVVVPLPRPWGPEVRSLTFLETRVVDTEGAEGFGFSWTPSIGAASVAAMLRHDIRDRVLGAAVDPVSLWEPLWQQLHEAGGGGVTTIALAGVDLALWDLAGVRSARPLAALLGSAGAEMAAYGSGVNLHYSTDELVAQARSWVARGYAAVKIKVGSSDLRRDIERVAAVREVVGDRPLMIDANQRWDVDRAVEALAALERFDPSWIEEPLSADDLDGYRLLAGRTGVPIACGENVYTHHRFGEFARSGAVQVLQPNLVRIGGITPLKRIDAVCADAGVTTALHLLPELSAQVVGALRAPSPVEVVDGAELEHLGVLAEPSPISLAHGRVGLRPHSGIGIRFTRENHNPPA